MSDAAMVREQVDEFKRSIETLRLEIGKAIVGHKDVVDGVLTCMLAGGHALLEGVPGLGKTMLVRTLSETLSLSFSRVQFTPDLMPADILGTTVIDDNAKGGKSFEFRRGPIFANIVLADEINRAPAKVQSALLEVMQEEQVTIGGTTYSVPTPYIVMATQNPIESEGTYPLPEAQVDRFLMKIIVDYPSVGEEAAVVGRSLVAPVVVRECLALEDLERHSQTAATISADREIIGYAVALADATRHPAKYGLQELESMIEFGSSPRGPIGLVQAARVLALLRGRGSVHAQDIRDLAADVLRHRIVLSYDALSDGVTVEELLDRILGAVTKPGSERLIGGAAVDESPAPFGAEEARG